MLPGKITNRSVTNNYNRANCFNGFHPLLSNWFCSTYDKPTDIQEKAWPLIADENHVLVTAPTGSGKTLTAFLWAINQLITQTFKPGNVRVLYISPLKALNNDIRRNLITPLNSLKAYFNIEKEYFPDIGVETRSGDTPAANRRKMLRTPPEILITTPESLNLLLSSGGGRNLLRGLKTVILDEIHGVINTKRGIHLMSAVERLVFLSGEFQRIILSATVKPLDIVASFAGGYQLKGDVRYASYIPRKVIPVTSTTSKQYELTVDYPDTETLSINETIWTPLVRTF